MLTQTLIYIPVVDRENQNEPSLSVEAKSQVDSFNSNADYTLSQVHRMLGADTATKQRAINQRLQFIYTRVDVLIKRLDNCNVCRTADYHNNFLIAFASTRGNVMANPYSFPIDTSAALEESKLRDLIQLYTYEVIQLGRLMMI